MPDAWLLDSNILLRMSKSDDPHMPILPGFYGFWRRQTQGFASPLRYWGSFGTLRHVLVTGMDLD